MGSPATEFQMRTATRRRAAVGALALAVLAAAAVSTREVLDIRIPAPALYATVVLLAGIVAWLGTHLIDLRLAHARDLKRLDDESARERYLVGLATLAAGTAHEMGTPLSTMALVVGDMRRSSSLPPDWKESVEVLWNQVQICRHSLLGLARASSLDKLATLRAERARPFVRSIVERFRRMRPRVPVTLRYEESVESPVLRVDQTLHQALLSLLGNAADASPGSVELRACASEGTLTIRILDRGPGIAPELRERLGKQPVQPRDGGHGLGSMLAHSAIQRLGGVVLLQDREGGGTCVQVELPLLEEDSAQSENFMEAPLASG